MPILKHTWICGIGLVLLTSAACVGPAPGDDPSQGDAPPVGETAAVTTSYTYRCYWNEPGEYFNGEYAESLVIADATRLSDDGGRDWVPRTGQTTTTATFATSNLDNYYGRASFVLDIHLLSGATSGNVTEDLPAAYDGVHDYYMHFTCRR